VILQRIIEEYALDPGRPLKLRGYSVEVRIEGQSEKEPSLQIAGNRSVGVAARCSDGVASLRLSKKG
jgi:hypothetical protein